MAYSDRTYVGMGPGPETRTNKFLLCPRGGGGGAAWPGGCVAGGVHAHWGTCMPGGWCAWFGGMRAQGVCVAGGMRAMHAPPA